MSDGCRIAAQVRSFATRRVLPVVVLAFSALLFLPLAHGQDSSRLLEYKFKASYLCSLPTVVTWPTNVATSGTNPIVVGVMGDSKTVATLKENLEGKRLKERPFVLQEVTNGASSTGCHILFVTRSAGKTPEEVIQEFGSKPVLLVGETDEFAENGGMIGFVPSGQTYRLTANPEAASKAGLRVSSQLAYIARMVKTRGGT